MHIYFFFTYIFFFLPTVFTYYAPSQEYSNQYYSQPDHQVYQEVPNTIDGDFSAHGYQHQSLGPVSTVEGHIENTDSSYSVVPSHRVGLVDQEISASNVNSARSDRSYSVGPILDDGPIPVPVPLQIFPSRLVFPQLNFPNGGKNFSIKFLLSIHF